MTYAGYTQIGGAIQMGGFCRGVLRNALKTILWTCDHEHQSREGAIACGYQAEGIARAAGLLPESRRVQWSDPQTWPRGLRERIRRSQ
jgi:hypothetical protein